MRSGSAESFGPRLCRSSLMDVLSTSLLAPGRMAKIAQPKWSRYFFAGAAAGAAPLAPAAAPAAGAAPGAPAGAAPGAPSAGAAPSAGTASVGGAKAAAAAAAAAARCSSITLVGATIEQTVKSRPRITGLTP